jgi:cell shape-determining protein MreD
MASYVFTYFIILVLTVVAPRLSLGLFIVISPWSQFATDALKWDPRLGWAILLAGRAALFSEDGSRQPLPRLLVWACSGFVLVAWAGLLHSGSEIPVDEMASCKITLLYFAIGLCAVYAIVGLTRTPRDMLLVAYAAAWSLIVASGFSILQARSGSLVDRISGTTGNPNSSAAHLAVAAIVMLMCWRLKLPHRWLYMMAVLMGVTACILTFSRMGIVACLIGLMLTIQVTRAGKTVNWKMVAVSILLVTIVMGAARGYLASVRNTHPSETDTESAEVSQEIADLTRLEALQFSARTFLERPIFGAGFGTIAARNYATNGIYVTSHDTYAQVLAGTGLVGAVLVLLIIVGIQRSLPESMKKYLIPFGAAFGFCGFFGDFLQSIELLVALGILLGIVRQLPAWKAEPGERENRPAEIACETQC